MHTKPVQQNHSYNKEFEDKCYASQDTDVIKDLVRNPNTHSTVVLNKHKHKKKGISEFKLECGVTGQ